MLKPKRTMSTTTPPPQEKQTTLPMRTPRPWHGMTPGIWFPLLIRNRFAVSLQRIPMALAISLVTWMNLVFALVSEAVYGRRARAVKLQQQPLFLIGHWRTGTTLLHELLVQDSRFIYATTFDCMAPKHFLLTAGFFTRWFDWLLPKKRPMDDMPVGFDRPQEDEFALMNLGLGSPYLEWAFENRGAKTEFLTFDTLPAETRERWKRGFDWFMRRQTLKNPSARIVLKSPPHTARLRQILELYPDARFIHIVRDPHAVIPSTIRMWKRMADAVGLQIRRDRPLDDQVFDTFQLMYDRFEQDKSLIPPQQFAQVRYEDLVANPLAQLEAMYTHLDLGDFGAARAAIEKYLEGVKDYKTNKHRVEESLAARIRARCGDYIRRYGYSDSAAPEATPAVPGLAESRLA